MNEPGHDALCARVARLERSSRTAWLVSALLGAALLAGLARPDTAADELRARRLVIEDAQGRPRIVVAAPLTTFEGRVRTDEAVGVVLLDEHGIDRVVLGSPTTNPQVKGKVVRRIGPSHGINVHDSKGNERGGFGVLDNDDRVVLGLDTDTGEGVALFVTPTYSGMAINAPGPEGPGQRAFFGTNPAMRTTVLNMDDYDDNRRFQITLGEDPRLEIYDNDGEPIVRMPEQHSD